jgi:hypothetical protein
MLIDSCVIARVTGDSIVGTTRTPTLTQVYSGVCSARALAASDADAGERQLELRTVFVRLPHDTTTIKVDDRVTLTSTHDGALNGRVLTVRNVRTDSYNTVRVLVCEDVQDG